MAEDRLTTAQLKEVDTILTVLGAYPDGLVKAALKRRNAHRRGERIAGGWKIHTGQGEPDLKLGNSMRIGNLWYTRERPAVPAAAAPSGMGYQPVNGRVPTNPTSESRHPKSKTDLSMKPTDKRCPVCGEDMAWEPICPGCTLGRMGFRGRYVCMDDFDHTFYVTKPGLELPNQ